jgi:chromosome segregation protein
MLLRKLSIFGFKSFADKTELHFGDGMTAVIGPNGCGKSNVVDAVRWVFGEQKASTLRSDTMQDVIFSGSEKRQPLNFAEVTLTISNVNGVLPVEYNEVAITRRIFRSGDSEYLLNKIPSRLRDIQNMFLDTGIGTTAYTTIENSMINKILSDKADERRILFEEAAGIGKYKQRVRESQRKLDHTRQDLVRINDRVQEKDRYARMLCRQVEKAQRYKQYFDDLLKLEVGYENRRYRMLSQAIDGHKRAIAGFEATTETLRARIAAEESHIASKELTKTEKETEVQIASRNVSETSDRINALDREISVSKQSLSLLKQSITRFDQEIEDFDAQNSQKKEFLNNIEISLISRQTQLQEHSGKFECAGNELKDFENQIAAQKEKADELSVQQLNIVHSAGQKHKELSNCQKNKRSDVWRINGKSIA